MVLQYLPVKPKVELLRGAEHVFVEFQGIMAQFENQGLAGCVLVGTFAFLAASADKEEEETLVHYDSFLELEQVVVWRLGGRYDVQELQQSVRFAELQSLVGLLNSVVSDLYLFKINHLNSCNLARIPFLSLLELSEPIQPFRGFIFFREVGISQISRLPLPEQRLLRFANVFFLLILHFRFFYPRSGKIKLESAT